MQAKQKVTLYLSSELHRRLKIRAAIDTEPMSELAERAIVFYLAHPELVEEGSYYGRTHQIYDCPKCEASVVIKNGEMVPLSNQPVVANKKQLPIEQVPQLATEQEGKEQLVPC